MYWNALTCQPPRSQRLENEPYANGIWTMHHTSHLLSWPDHGKATILCTVILLTDDGYQRTVLVFSESLGMQMRSPEIRETAGVCSILCGVQDMHLPNSLSFSLACCWDIIYNTVQICKDALTETADVQIVLAELHTTLAFPVGRPMRCLVVSSQWTLHRHRTGQWMHSQMLSWSFQPHCLPINTERSPNVRLLRIFALVGLVARARALSLSLSLSSPLFPSLPLSSPLFPSPSPFALLPQCLCLSTYLRDSTCVFILFNVSHCFTVLWLLFWSCGRFMHLRMFPRSVLATHKMMQKSYPFPPLKVVMKITRSFF